MASPFSEVIEQQKNHNMPPYLLCGVIQVSSSPDIQMQLEIA